MPIIDPSLDFNKRLKKTSSAVSKQEILQS